VLPIADIFAIFMPRPAYFAFVIDYFRHAAIDADYFGFIHYFAFIAGCHAFSCFQLLDVSSLLLMPLRYDTAISRHTLRLGC